MAIDRKTNEKGISMGKSWIGSLRINLRGNLTSISGKGESKRKRVRRDDTSDIEMAAMRHKEKRDSWHQKGSRHYNAKSNSSEHSIDKHNYKRNLKRKGIEKSIKGFK